MKRQRVEERKWFAPEEKDFILSKSHGRCCHCGKRISVGKDFTVEHVIPLAKGGTNNIENVVALCKDCNDNKQDKILDPYYYLKYLDKTYLQEVIDNQERYYLEFSWFSRRNFVPTDRRIIELKYLMPYSYNKKSKKPTYMVVKYFFDKADYSDLNDIYEYIWRYNRKYNVESTRSGLKESVSDVFEKGAFYTLRSSNNELIAVIPLALVKMDMFEHKDLCMLAIKNIICVYSKDKYIDIISECVMDIIGGASAQEFVNKAIPVRLEKLKNDPLSSEVYRLLGGAYGAYIANVGCFEQSILLMRGSGHSNTSERVTDKTKGQDNTFLKEPTEDDRITDDEFFACVEDFTQSIVNSLEIDSDSILDW